MERKLWNLDEIDVFYKKLYFLYSVSYVGSKIKLKIVLKCLVKIKFPNLNNFVLRQLIYLTWKVVSQYQSVLICWKQLLSLNWILEKIEFLKILKINNF